MTIVLDTGAIAQTTAGLTVAGITGAPTSLDVQLSPRRDFQFCVCPTYSYASGAAVALLALNAGSTYWARVRERYAGGTVNDWSNTVAFTTTAGAARVTTPAAIMIEPAIVVTPLPVIAAAAATELAGFPSSNLFRDSPVALRKTSDAAGLWNIDIQASGAPLDTIAMLNTNLPEAATWRVYGGAAQGSTTYDSGSVAFRASPNLPQRAGWHGLIQLPAPVAYRWYRIQIATPALPADMLHAEHMVVGLNRASKNHAVEKTETPAPMTSSERKRSGVADRVRGLPTRKVDFELQMLTEAQYETIYGDLWRHEDEPVFVVPNSKRGAFFHDRFLYGDLGGGRIVNVSSPRYTRSFTVTSII